MPLAVLQGGGQDEELAMVEGGLRWYRRCIQVTRGMDVLDTLGCCYLGRE